MVNRDEKERDFGAAVAKQVLSGCKRRSQSKREMQRKNGNNNAVRCLLVFLLEIQLNISLCKTLLASRSQGLSGKTN